MLKIIEIFCIAFFVLGLWKPSVYFTFTARLNSDQPHFKMLNSHVWLVATILDSAALKH